jgi:hypothetical protein
VKVFTVHEHPGPAYADRDPVLLKEGFCWPAFLLGALWALACGMWLRAAAMILAAAALMAALALAGADATTALAAWVGFALILGFGGNDWLRARLERRGLRFAGVVAAQDRDGALRRWFDLAPPAPRTVPPPVAWPEP